MTKSEYRNFLEIKNKFASTQNKTNKNNAKSLEKTHGLTSYQIALMVNIYFSKPQQIKDIEEYFFIKQPNASRLVNSLIARGLVKKINQPGKKAVFADLTEMGYSLIDAEVDASIEVGVKELNRRISDAEQKELVRLYKRITEILSRML